MEADADAGEVQPGSQTLPLNSRRLTAARLRQLARGMDLPTTATIEDLRQIIDGKVAEMGHEPRNVQVQLHPDRLELLDLEGSFLNVTTLGGDPGRGYEGEADSIPALSDAGLEDGRGEVDELREWVETLTAEKTEQANAIQALQEQLEEAKQRMRTLWRTSCAQLEEYDRTLADRDAQIAELVGRVQLLEGISHPPGRTGHPPGGPGTSDYPSELRPPGIRTIELAHTDHATAGTHPHVAHKGKAPPIRFFTGEGADDRLEDWLPILERAAAWNGWTADETLMQLPGYLQGKALHEWNLLSADDRKDYETAKRTMLARLDSGARVLAAHDFRHVIQKDKKSVADFISRLENTFRIAYGREGMSTETKDMLMHSQLQEGLSYDLMQAPAVSGALTYPELCMAAKNEEKRLATLKQRWKYLQSTTPPLCPSESHHKAQTPKYDRRTPSKNPPIPPKKIPGARRCYNCDEVGHLARDCKQKSSESTGRTPRAHFVTKQVTTRSVGEDLTRYLYSDSDEEAAVNVVRVNDQGSQPRCAKVQIEGVPMYGIVDSGADITIIGGTLFKKVAAVARLRKRDLQKPDKVPRTYDQKPFQLDGKMMMNVSFGDKTMRTAVYIKMDAHDQLLLSEGVCRQLSIITYHPDVQVWRGGRRLGGRGGVCSKPKDAKVPTVRVRLLQTVRILPLQQTTVDVVIDHCRQDVPLLLEPCEEVRQSVGLTAEAALLKIEDGKSRIMLTNSTGFSQVMPRGSDLGEVVEVAVVQPSSHPEVGRVTTLDVDEATSQVDLETPRTPSERTKMLLDLLNIGGERPDIGQQKLVDMLSSFQDVFSLEPGERGETDLVKMEINTQGAAPVRQPVRRVPFAVRTEIAKQLREMQERGVVEPSASAWASPVVMVRKKDGSHRFCVDYRRLNAVTKKDQFPLPRIDDLLDQLGKSGYFSTLDLASGYWQIRMEPSAQEKTAFVTPQGLYEFRVMPFGLTNAPAVFQRLMQRVIKGLNPEEGPDYVAVYIDDILIFSRTLEDHLEHIRSVLERLKETKLKLKPQKCSFLRSEVEYLGHTISPQGLKTNSRIVEAVRAFPAPTNVKQVRQFLGMASYYRRFIPQFAKVAQPLHALTQKGARFLWSEECGEAFRALKDRLTNDPVLAYPDFDQDFTVETDASIRGLGAILSQKDVDEDSTPSPMLAELLLVVRKTMPSQNWKHWLWYGDSSTSSSTSMDTMSEY